MKPKNLLLCMIGCSVLACKKGADVPSTTDPSAVPASALYRQENPSGFAQIGSITIGGVGAAEISAFDPGTNRLFVVNNSSVNRIDVVDLSVPSNPVVTGSISIAPYGGLVNSVAVSDGKLAAAIEASVKQDNGKVVVFRTDDLTEVKVITVGALPDMVTYSPNGKLILTANEGEPNSSYTVDPVGSVSIISVKDDYAVQTLDFSSFASQEAALKSRGLRKFGPNASFAQDMEPEYITVAEDSRTAWVTLQENNAIARIDLRTNTITDIFPLGFKDFSSAGNLLDPTDRPLGTLAFGNWPVYGIYQPDAIAVWVDKGIPYLFTANEGDAREYSALNEEGRVSTLALDPTAFPNGTFLKNVNNMGRLNITRTMGDTDGDGDYDQLYAFGARSFSVWNGTTGQQVWDSKNGLEARAVTAGVYDDDRSDNKGVEPEGLALGEVGKRMVAFVGMERADAVALYDVTNPAQPTFLQLLKTGDAPEGVLFISDKDSPIKRSLLVVSSENDGKVMIFATSK